MQTLRSTGCISGVLLLQFILQLGVVAVAANGLVRNGGEDEHGRAHHQSEHANVEKLFGWYDTCEAEAQSLISVGLPLPAYEQVTKASHTFNLLDARRAISVTERQRYILRVRALSRAVAEAYYAQREKLGFPGLKARKEAA